MTIRIPQNHLSSRAEATGSFQIRPRVGHDELPSPARLSHHHPLTNRLYSAASTVSLFSPCLLVFLSSSHSLLLCHCFSRPFLPTILVSVRLFLSHSLFLLPAPSYAHFCAPIIASASCFLLSHGLFSWLP